MPAGVALPGWFDSSDLVARTAASLVPWLGLNSSEVSSVCEKSSSAVTVARRLSRPTTGSSRSITRLRCVASTSRRYCSCCWSRPCCAPWSWLDSSAPLLSSTLTDLALSSGTLDDTRCTMPATWARSSVRPGCSVSTTDAPGFCCSRKKPFWFGSARCTRAACTDCSDWMVRVSSPSSARCRLMRSWPWVWPKGVLSSSS